MGKWERGYTKTLRSAAVVILPDNDTPGRAHGELVAQSLNGIAASVKVLALPNLPDKDDVSDWLQAGGTRAELDALVDQSPLHNGQSPVGEPAPGGDAPVEIEIPDGVEDTEPPLEEERTETAAEAAEMLVSTLETLGDDAQEDAILDALPALAPLDTISWMRLKRRLKVCAKSLNLNDLEKARNELRRQAKQQAQTQASGSSQAHIAARLAKDYADKFAYDLSRQAWIKYDNGLWTQRETERFTHQISFLSATSYSF